MIVPKNTVGHVLPMSVSDCRTDPKTQIGAGDIRTHHCMLTRPDGRIVQRTGSTFNAGQERLEYVTARDDLDMQGDWYYTFFIELNSGYSAELRPKEMFIVS